MLGAVAVKSPYPCIHVIYIIDMLLVTLQFFFYHHILAYLTSIFLNSIEMLLVSGALKSFFKDVKGLGRLWKTSTEESIH